MLMQEILMYKYSVGLVPISLQSFKDFFLSECSCAVMVMYIPLFSRLYVSWQWSYV